MSKRSIYRDAKLSVQILATKRKYEITFSTMKEFQNASFLEIVWLFTLFTSKRVVSPIYYRAFIIET